MLDYIKNREPVYTVGFVQACLGFALAFGAPLSGEQVGAIMALTAAGLAWLLRKAVSPSVRSAK